MSTNSHQNSPRHARVTHLPWRAHQKTSLMKLTKSRPCGPPAASDGPFSTDKAHARGDHPMSNLQEFFNEIFAGTMLRLKPQASHRGAATHEKLATPPIHGPRRTHVIATRRVTCKKSSTKSLQGPRQRSAYRPSTTCETLNTCKMARGTDRRPAWPTHKM